MKNSISKMTLGLVTMMISMNGMASMMVETLDHVRNMIHIDKVTNSKNCNQEMVVQKDNLNEELRIYLGDDKTNVKIQNLCALEMSGYLKNYCSRKIELFNDVEKLMTQDKVQAIRSNLGPNADDRAVGEVVNFKIQRSLDLTKKRWTGYVDHFALAAKCPLVKKNKKDFENELHLVTDFVKQRFQDTLITASSDTTEYKGSVKQTPLVTSIGQ